MSATFVPLNPQTNRRYDLDWLRVLVFGLLIFYHTGMLYVANWGFHYKSQYTSQALEGVMLAVNQWRMPLLWLISGISIRYVLQKMSVIGFVAARSSRLLLPLLFGILVIVPPQLYVEMTYKGDLDMSYVEFYRIFFDLDNPIFAKYQPGILPHIDVNHLWYLRELWTYSLAILLLSPLLHHRYVQLALDWLLQKTGLWGLLLLPLIPLLAVEILYPDNRNATGFLFLVYGYLIGWNLAFWDLTKQFRKTSLLILLISYVLIVVAYFNIWLDPALKAQPWVQWLGLLVLVNCWTGVLAVLGYAAMYLNQSGPKLKYLSDAVLPFYILHQSFIVVLAFCLTPLQLGPVLEPIIIIIATFAGCFVSYEIIRRVSLLRPLFGLKWAVKPTDSQTKQLRFFDVTRRVLACMILLPFAWLILF